MSLVIALNRLCFFLGFFFFWFTGADVSDADLPKACIVKNTENMFLFDYYHIN